MSEVWGCCFAVRGAVSEANGFHVLQQWSRLRDGGCGTHREASTEGLGAKGVGGDTYDEVGRQLDCCDVFSSSGEGSWRKYRLNVCLIMISGQIRYLDKTLNPEILILETGEQEHGGYIELMLGSTIMLSEIDVMT